MKCAKCGLESDSGQTHKFYYGRTYDSSTKTEELYGTKARRSITTTRYIMGGSEEVFLCNKCISTEKATASKRDSRGGIIASLVASVFFLGLVCGLSQVRSVAR